MRNRILALLLCVCTLISLCACSVPEEYRFVNPTETFDWEPTEPPTTQATEPAPTETEPPHLTAADIAASLADHDLVAQLFLVKCPTGKTEELLREHHIGGIVLFEQDITGETPESLRTKLDRWQELSPIPLVIAVDEEGGSVTRISSDPNFRSERFGRPRDIYFNGGLDALRETETEKSQLLKRCGINVNLAPVCDVVSEEGGFMASRSLFQTATITGKAVATMVKAMQSNSVGAVLKHFPGYGNLSGDTHTGIVVDDRSKEFLQEYDFVPFAHGIRAGVGAVMVGHSVVNALDKQAPASLSAEVHRVLREELGFQGVIITDDLMMGAITKSYDPGKAALLAIQTGNDLLITAWSEHQYDTIYNALSTGELSRDTLVACVTRIIQWKMDLGLL